MAVNDELAILMKEWKSITTEKQIIERELKNRQIQVSDTSDSDSDSIITDVHIQGVNASWSSLPRGENGRTQNQLSLVPASVPHSTDDTSVERRIQEGNVLFQHLTQCLFEPVSPFNENIQTTHIQKDPGIDKLANFPSPLTDSGSGIDEIEITNSKVSEKADQSELPSMATERNTKKQTKHDLTPSVKKKIYITSQQRKELDAITSKSFKSTTSSDFCSIIDIVNLPCGPVHRGKILHWMESNKDQLMKREESYKLLFDFVNTCYRDELAKLDTFLMSLMETVKDETDIFRILQLAMRLTAHSSEFDREENLYQGLSRWLSTNLKTIKSTEVKSYIVLILQNIALYHNDWSIIQTPYIVTYSKNVLEASSQDLEVISSLRTVMRWCDTSEGHSCIIKTKTVPTIIDIVEKCLAREDKNEVLLEAYLTLYNVVLKNVDPSFPHQKVASMIMKTIQEENISQDGFSALDLLSLLGSVENNELSPLLTENDWNILLQMFESTDTNENTICCILDCFTNLCQSPQVSIFLNKRIHPRLIHIVKTMKGEQVLPRVIRLVVNLCNDATSEESASPLMKLISFFWEQRHFEVTSSNMQAGLSSLQNATYLLLALANLIKGPYIYDTTSKSEIILAFLKELPTKELEKEVVQSLLVACQSLLLTFKTLRNRNALSEIIHFVENIAISYKHSDREEVSICALNVLPFTNDIAKIFNIEDHGYAILFKGLNEHAVLRENIVNASLYGLSRIINHKDTLLQLIETENIVVTLLNWVRKGRNTIHHPTIQFLWNVVYMHGDVFHANKTLQHDVIRTTLAVIKAEIDMKDKNECHEHVMEVAVTFLCSPAVNAIIESSAADEILPLLLDIFQHKYENLRVLQPALLLLKEMVAEGKKEVIDLVIKRMVHTHLMKILKETTTKKETDLIDQDMMMVLLHVTQMLLKYRDVKVSLVKEGIVQLLAKLIHSSYSTSETLMAAFNANLVDLVSLATVDSLVENDIVPCLLDLIKTATNREVSCYALMMLVQKSPTALRQALDGGLVDVVTELLLSGLQSKKPFFSQMEAESTLISILFMQSHWCVDRRIEPGIIVRISKILKEIPRSIEFEKISGPVITALTNVICNNDQLKTAALSEDLLKGVMEHFFEKSDPSVHLQLLINVASSEETLQKLALDKGLIRHCVHIINHRLSLDIAYFPLVALLQGTFEKEVMESKEIPQYVLNTISEMSDCLPILNEYKQVETRFWTGEEWEEIYFFRDAVTMKEPQANTYGNSNNVTDITQQFKFSSILDILTSKKYTKENKIGEQIKDLGPIGLGKDNVQKEIKMSSKPKDLKNFQNALAKVKQPNTTERLKSII